MKTFLKLIWVCDEYGILPGLGRNRFGTKDAILSLIWDKHGIKLYILRWVWYRGDPQTCPLPTLYTTAWEDKINYRETCVLISSINSLSTLLSERKSNLSMESLNSMIIAPCLEQFTSLSFNSVLVSRVLDFVILLRCFICVWTVQMGKINLIILKQ